MHIPLLLYAPGLQPRRIDCPVSQVDLLPTLLDLLGLEPPAGTAFDGVDLVPLLHGAPCPARPLFAESIEGGFQAREDSARTWVFSVREGAHKLIVRRDQRGRERFEAYDLASDPYERHDLAATHAALTSRLLRLLRAYQDAAGGVERWWRPLREAPPEPAAVPLAARPRILRPRDGERVAWAGADGTLTASWTGSPVAEYVIEYDIGAGATVTRGRLTVHGNTYSYGPVPEDVWNELVAFNPWRVRVYPAGRPHLASDWVTFELLAAGVTGAAR